MSKKEISPEKTEKIIREIREFIFQYGLANGDEVVDRDGPRSDSKNLVAELVDIILDTVPN